MSSSCRCSSLPPTRVRCSCDSSAASRSSRNCSSWAEKLSHALAPDAQYYRAETFVQTGETDQALEEFARVLELYPNSRRAPTALYRSGVVEVERGRTDDALLFFTRIVQGYPDSDEAKLAEDQLRRLNQ